MRWRFLLLVPVAAWAATAAQAADSKDWVQPPAQLPHAQQLSDPTSSLDFLFDALKIAPDDETAHAIEQRIWAIWAVSKSDTANLLMTRVRKAIEDKDLDLALKLLDAIVRIKPDYVEAWNRRATIYFMKNDFGKSLADIRHVLKLEPRHFGALSGLGLILQELGDDRHALDVYRRALAIYPRLERVPDTVKRLEEKVEGKDI
ncbi:MAG: tetratricopeptide repeat protein [Pseudolabrys sp.]|jgi:tetratricopeptide (TPR) repeat protein|nr:tetratricopeptide repeat protein [Pseudolabrys sp.]